MKLSTVHKQRLSKITRVTAAAALVAGSVGGASVSSVSANALSVNTTTITDSRPGQLTDYIINFTPPQSSTTAIAQVTVKFCNSSGSWSGCVAPTGLSLETDISSASASGFAGVGTSTAGTFNRIADNEFDFVVDTPDAEADIVHTINLTGLVTNPTSAGTYYTMVQTYSDTSDTLIDEGTSAFAILNKVDVTGRVAESMTFTVNGVNTGSTCGGENATVTSTATSVPFGNFASGTPRVACQTIAVATNAVGGYTTSVKHVRMGASPQGGMCRQTSTNCTASGAASDTPAADVIVDANLSATPAAWGNGTTFGVGLNANGGQATSNYNNVATDYLSMFNAARNVATSAGPTSAVNTTVKLKADVPATQTAGVYQNSFEYITTPIF